ncbi:hypothetical protein FZC75_06380 [Sutcliffiella horikoshii]|uniref:Uncharacterized protein n=1 Tax=Sutcliffiella horikoshii TaxID=79883 RepID=A0A5D4TDX8_9BACI|nr:hypothetical protein FZC75_06380 [Sutcliffiella horikoshii]
MRPRKAKPEEAHGPPAGKRSAWNGNQPDIIFAYHLPTKKPGIHLVPHSPAFNYSDESRSSPVDLIS